MTEGPPVKVSPEGVEIEPKKVGHRYADWIVAGAAIMISLISLGVAVKHGQIMERLVAANSWPLLQYTSGNSDEDGKPVINLSIENVGVGPAIIKHFTAFYHGKRYIYANDLLLECCMSVKSFAGLPTITNFVEGHVIRQGENTTFLNMERTDKSLPVWMELDKARFDIKFDVCYCSVFNECWRSDLISVEPRQVEQCPAPAGGSRPRQSASTAGSRPTR